MSLRQSDSFIWSVSELIGQGATGNVFICRSKNTGKAYAAKVFNTIGQLRAREVRIREIELLRKLSHPNIVKLKGEETELSSKSTVLIMELCETSLYNILELPENYYGLSEEEFQNVFEDVANGMKYLKEQKVVHRDVKPGNILRKRCIMGRALFKLTDFGAARELQKDDQRFISIYGTEEYLHPDVYEKAVMKNFSRKSFSAAVDLWSMGVTFYHTATGQLPFRPYGGRQNKETMFEIISQKGPGIISGVQKSNAGNIDYDANMPEDTRMSNALKSLLKPALQELLETNAARFELMINFDQFYNRAHDIVHRKVIDLYCVATGTWHLIYMKSNETVKYLQDLIQEQTGIAPDKQLLFHSSKEFTAEPTSQCKNIVTTRENPLIVIGGDALAADQLYLRRISQPPRMPKGKTRPDNDIDILKTFNEEEDCGMQEHLLPPTEYFEAYWDYSIKVILLRSDMNILEKAEGSSHENKDLHAEVISLHAKAEMCTSRVSEHVSELLSNADQKLQFNNWSDMRNEPDIEIWLESMKKLVADVNDVYVEVSRMRHFGQSNLEDLIHVAKKQKVTDSLERIKETFAKLKSERNKLHEIVNEWITENHLKFKEVVCLQKCLSAEEGSLFDEVMLQSLDQVKVLSGRYLDSLFSKQANSSYAAENSMPDFDVINTEVLSLESLFQDITALVEEGDQKLLRTKEIFDELTIQKFPVRVSLRKGEFSPKIRGSLENSKELGPRNLRGTRHTNHDPKARYVAEDAPDGYIAGKSLKILDESCCQPFRYVAEDVPDGYIAGESLKILDESCCQPFRYIAEDVPDGYIAGKSLKILDESCCQPFRYIAEDVPVDFIVGDH
eukprot:gene5922-6608_t